MDGWMDGPIQIDLYLSIYLSIYVGLELRMGTARDPSNATGLKDRTRPAGRPGFFFSLF
jgi:hypothetical protein